MGSNNERGHSGWRIVVFQTRESFVYHAQNFEFYPKIYGEYRMILNKRIICLKIFVLKALPGSSVESINYNNIDGE